MYSTYNESTSAITERFIKTLKVKIYKKMTANDSKFYLNYLKKLVGQCNNTYHHSIGKKAINTDCHSLSEKIETNPKAPNFKVNNRVGTSEYKNITENWARKIFITDSVLKTNPWTYKIKDLQGEK